MSKFQGESPRQTQECTQSVCDEYKDDLTTFTRSDILKEAGTQESGTCETLFSKLTVTSRRAVKTTTAMAAIRESDDVTTTTTATAAILSSDDGAEDSNHPGRATATKRLP